MRSLLFKVLKEVKIFHALTDEELTYLMDLVDVQSYEKDITIIEEGSIGTEMFVILSGSVDVVKKDDNGETKKIITLYEEDSIGEMTLLDVQKRTASVIANEKTFVAELKYSSLLEVYHKNKDMYIKIIMNIAREFSRRLRHMDELYVEFLQTKPEKILKEKN